MIRGLFLFLWIFRNSFLKGRFTEFCWRRFINSACNSGDLSTEIHLKKRTERTGGTERTRGTERTGGNEK